MGREVTVKELELEERLRKLEASFADWRRRVAPICQEYERDMAEKVELAPSIYGEEAMKRLAKWAKGQPQRWSE